MFVPKFPLPFPPETFVELILPHLEQIKQFAQFRIDVAKIRQAATSGSSKEELTKMVNAAWKPIPELKTWVGTFGQPEATMQEMILKKLIDEGLLEKVGDDTFQLSNWQEYNQR